MILLICMILLSTSCATRRDSDAADSRVKSLVESRNFRFDAQFATPMGGRQIQITGPYDLVISGKTITAHLPYYGVAYRAPIGADEPGIKFSSTDFTYTVSERKSGWNIRITPKDQQEVRALNLRIGSSGMASLQVTSNYRQSISYSGKVVPVNEKSW